MSLYCFTAVIRSLSTSGEQHHSVSEFALRTLEIP